jgi:hypothetical protein
MSAIDMISKEKFTEFLGFSVYDINTGNPVDYDFLIDTDGKLCCMTTAGVIEMEKGNFIIQFADGKYMRW